MTWMAGTSPAMTNERLFDRLNAARYDNYRFWVNPAVLGPRDVLQHLRPHVPGHDLRRKPWDRDRLCGRWLPAAAAADQRRHPARSRSPPPRAVALHQPAPGARCGKDPLRGDGASGDRRAGDDGH